MLILSKLKSKKGYIFTFEAIVAVMIILMIFYVGYFAITHNILTIHEEKRDIEAFEKSNLIANKLFKDHEFPSNSYIPDYLKFINRVRERYYTSSGNTIPGTFDPLSIRGIGNEGIIRYNLTIHSNVNNTNIIGSMSYNFSNKYVKTKNLLIPVKTWNYPSTYGINENISKGEILYFGTKGSSKLNYINISAPQSVDVVLSVNGVPFRMQVNSNPKISEFGKVINTHSSEIYQPNEIKILNISSDVPVTLNIAYSNISTIYVLKLRPANISCIVPLMD